MSLKLKLDSLESQNGSVKDKKAYDFNTEVGTYSGEIKDGNMLEEYVDAHYYSSCKGVFKEGSLHGQGVWDSPYKRAEGEFKHGNLYEGSFDDRINKFRGTTLNGTDTINERYN